MPARTLTQLASRLRREAIPNGLVAETDRDLLLRFLQEQDEAAFETLVRRHDRLVRSAIAKVLSDPHDAEDAFQATFLVLVRRAKAIDWRSGLGPWLYGVAHRVAVKARDAGRTRSRKESEAGAKPRDPEPPDLSWREACALLHAELDALPDRYRLPLLLCYLEGKTRDEAAAALKLSPGTVKGRLERGRRMLRDRLARRGVTLSAGLLAAVSAGSAGASSPSGVSAVLEVVRGAAPARVLALTREATMSAILVKLTKTVAVVLGLAVIASALFAVGSAKPTEQPKQKATVTPPAPRPAEAKPAQKESALAVKGVVLGPDDRPVPGAKLFLFRWEKLEPAPQPAAGEDGTFSFTVPETESGSLMATAPGYGLGWGELHYPRPLTAVTVRLTPEEPIRGRVVNLEGKPVAGVSVSVVALYRPDKVKTLDDWLEAMRDPAGKRYVYLWPLTDSFDGGLTAGGLITSATSDRDGKFEIRGIGRDRVTTLRVTGPTTATHEVKVVTRKVERFTARGFHTGDADVFHGSEPTLVAAPVPVTTGRVLDGATGKPVPGTVVWVQGLAQQGLIIQGLKAVADADGRFTLPGLPQGRQVLSVVVPPGGQPYHRIQLQVPDDPAARGAFDIKLTRGIPATVKIVDKASGQPVRANLRYGVFPDDNPNAKAVPNVWHQFCWSDSPWVLPMQSEFRIVVFPGKGLLAAASLWSGQYLTGVGAEAFEKYRQEEQLYGLVSSRNIHIHSTNTFAAIDVPADAKEFTFTLALERGVTVSGRLVDAGGKPVVEAESFGLKHTMHGDPAWSKPLTDATFTALALRPGEKRRVMFVHTGRKLAGSAVVIGGAKEAVEVRMEPWGEVTGRLVDADGKPVKGRLDMSYDVVRQPDPALGSSPLCRPGMAGIEAGPDGRFRIPGLVPGLTYRWIAESGGPTRLRVAVPDVVPKSGQTTDIGDVVLGEEGQ